MVGAPQEAGLGLPRGGEGLGRLFSMDGGDPDQIMGARLAEAEQRPPGIKLGIDPTAATSISAQPSCFASCGRFRTPAQPAF